MNDPVIRRATADGLGRADLHALWQRALPGDQTARAWWNGLGVFYLEKGARAQRRARDMAAVA